MRFATFDLSGPYRKVFTLMMPRAIQVADPFHLVKLANTKLDECRRRVQNETLGHRGRKSDPLYRCRRLLTKAEERLDEGGRAKLLGLLRAGDPHGDVATMWQAKEAVRELYAHGDPDLALEWVTQLSRDLQDTDYPIEARSLGRTLGNWKHEIAAWHHAHVSNGPTEAANNLIKRVKRAAFGFRPSATTGSGHCSTPASPTGRCSRRSALADPGPLATRGSPRTTNQSGTLHSDTATRAASTTDAVVARTLAGPHDQRGASCRMWPVRHMPGHCATSSRVSTSTHNPSSSSSTLSTCASGKPIIIAAMRSGSLSVCPSMCEG